MALLLSKEMSRGVAGYGYGIIAGLFSAFVVNFALTHPATIFVLMAYIACVPLFAAGLGAGIVSGIIACVTGTVCIFETSPASFGTSFGIFYLIVDAIPALVVIALAMRHYPLPDGSIVWSSAGHILAALTLYPCLIFLGVYSVVNPHEGGLLPLTLNALSGVTDQVTQMLVEKGIAVTPDVTIRIHRYIEVFARITPATFICAWLFSTIIAMVVAQIFLQQRRWMIRPAITLTDLHVPNWIIFTAAVSGLAAQLAPAPYDYISLNLAIVFCIPFFFIGLAVVHAWAASTRVPTLILIAFYSMISIIIYLVPVVALLGAVDQGIDFRKRFADRKKN